MNEASVLAPRRKKFEWLSTQIGSDARQMPKYQVVSSALVKALSNGVWESGEKLPTESELARALSLSHGTIQKAYQVLVADGLVVRRRGSGTYVTDARREMRQPWHCRFVDDEGNVLPVFTQIIDSEVQAPKAEALAVLGEAASIGRIDRKIRIGTDLVVLSRFYACDDIIRSLLDLSPDVIDGANFKHLLLSDLGQPIVSIIQTVVQCRLDRTVAGPVLSRPGSQGLKIQATARDGKYVPIYYQELYVPPTTRRLLFESVYRP